MVADTFSSTLGFLIMGTGNDNNSWGTNCNASIFPVFEDAIANVATFANTSGTVDLSGSPPPAAASQARFWQLKFTGSLSGNLTVKVPNLTKEWFINNACTLNGNSLLMQTPTGATTTIPTGWWRVWCDGSNGINIWPEGSSQIQMPAASAAAPSYSSLQETNSGIYRNTTQDWRFSVAGVDIIRVTGAGAGAPNLLDILSGKSLAFNGVIFDPGAVVPSGTEADYAGIFAPTGWYFAEGSAKSRTTDSPLFNALTTTGTGNTHTSTTLDNLSADFRGLGLEGAFVEGTGIQLGTTIISINGGVGSSFTLSQATLSTVSGLTFRVLPYGQGDGSTTFNIPDRRGVVVAGRDNMGGTARNLLTLAQTQGILGTKLNALGGEQGHTPSTAELVSHTHTDSGHAHTITPMQTGQVQTGAGANVYFATGGTTNTSTNSAIITAIGGSVAHNNVQPTGISNRIIKR